MEGLSGLRVIVTGASKGIGRLLSSRLASSGARVLGVARSVDRLRVLEERFRGFFYGYPCDLGEQPCRCCDGVVEEALRRLGGIDVLVNNAGYAVYGNVYSQSLGDVLGQVYVNMVSAIHLTRRVLDYLLEKNRGVVVFVLTGAVYVYVRGLTVYGAAKAGLSYFAEALRHELEGTGVRVVTVYPGAVKGTEFFSHPSFRGKKVKWSTSVEKVVDAIIRGIVDERVTRIHVPWWVGLAGKLSQLFGLTVSI